MGLQDWIPPIVYNNLTDFFKVRKEGNGYWYAFASSRDSFKEIKYLESYEDIPELNAIINMKAKTFSNMVVKAVDKDGNEVTNPETERVKALLSKPNWFQDGKEFLIQTKTLREIFGNEYLYSQVPLGFAPSATRIKGLFTLPANIVKCQYKSEVPFFLNDSKTGVTYKYKHSDGVDYKDLPIEQIIHLNDNRAHMKSATDKNLLVGESKMKGLKVAINNIKMAYESRGVILKYRGADGAWVNKSKDAVGQSLPLTEDEKQRIQNSHQKYGTLDGQYQTIVTDQDLQWVQAGVKDPAKLGLFQEIEEDFNKMLDGYGVPSEIFVRTKGATYENQRQAEKGFYVRTVIPEANEWIGAVTSELNQDDKVTYVADYSRQPIFQEDLKSRADALGAAITALSKALADGAITIDQYQDEIDKYGIKRINNQK